MFERTCPNCNCIIVYKLKSSLLRANKKNSYCFKCCNIGQIISAETRLKISETLKGRPSTSSTKYKKGDNSGSESPMYGKSTYICLVEKYGKEEADMKYAAIKEKLSKRFSGKNNPSYGKTNKQGNGYSGWYKNWFFRSITELSYVLHLEQNNQTWISAESLKFYIPYINSKGTDRTYRPDFLVNNNLLVEIKPLRYQSSEINQIKKKAAIEFCKIHNYEYLMTDFEKIPLETLKNLYDSKIIKFTEKTEKKFNKYYKKHIKKAPKK